MNSYTVIEDKGIDLSCTLIRGFENGLQVNWTWTLNQQNVSAYLANYLIYNDDVKHKSTISLKNLPLGAGGNVSCVAQNINGQHSRRVLLRVKSSFFKINLHT